MGQHNTSRIVAFLRRLEAALAAALLMGCAAREPENWDTFWRKRGVTPPPPHDFLDFGPQRPEILNLTGGAISDEIAGRWVLADLRRAAGDQWAAFNLRVDLANADVLGPPGLNGTAREIQLELSRGTIGRSCDPSYVTVVKAAVIAIPPATQRRLAGARLTDFVIVFMLRWSGIGCERILADGRKELVPSVHRAGELSWQLDTGYFRADPIVGPIWYQARGWTCGTGRGGPLDEICQLVQARD